MMILPDREIRLFRAEAVGAVSNLLLNFLVIPAFSMNGAAATTVLAEVIVWAMTQYVVTRELGIRLFSGKQAARVCAGCILAGGSCVLLKSVFTIPLHSIIGIIVGLTGAALTFGILYLVAEYALQEETIRKAAQGIVGKVKRIL